MGAFLFLNTDIKRPIIFLRSLARYYVNPVDNRCSSLSKMYYNYINCGMIPAQQEMKDQKANLQLSLEPSAIIRNIRNYLAGRAVGMSRDEALLEEVLKVFFCLSDTVEKRISEDIFENSKVFRAEFTKIRSKFPDFYGPDEELLLDPHSIDYVAQGLRQLREFQKHNIDVVASLYQVFIGNHIRGQEGQFFTPKVAVDFLVRAVDPKPTWKIIDTACGACSFLTATYLYLKERYPEKDVQSFVKNNMFGIEKDKKLARLAKIHLTLLTGEVAHIYDGDSLLVGNPDLPKIKDGYFDLVITNPPFGSKIKSIDEETAKQYTVSYKWSGNNGSYKKTDTLNVNTPPQAIFMERNIRALKNGCLLATVVPESLLSNKNYKGTVQYILNNSDVECVIGMPESLFKISGKGGTHTKTDLMIVRRRDGSDTVERSIFFAEAKWCGHDSRGNIIPHDDLPGILSNYLKFRNKTYTESSNLGYMLLADRVDDNILAPKYYDADLENDKNSLSVDSHLVTIRELVERNILEISTGDEIGKLAYGTGDIPYIRTSDLTNWEVKNDAKHRVERSIYEKLKNKQDIQAGDILMVKDGTYLIGTLAMITKFDTEIIYQSHIYKIRVLSNEIGLTAYNLLGLLSSRWVQRQIKSKQLTQDIIDSLGKRIYDLLIPTPRNLQTLSDIDQEVKDIITLKEKTKEHTFAMVNKLNSVFSLQ